MQTEIEMIKTSEGKNGAAASGEISTPTRLRTLAEIAASTTLIARMPADIAAHAARVAARLRGTAGRS